MLAPAVAALGPCIRLSSIVTAIEWQRHRVRVRYASPGGRVHQPLTARAVVVAVPLGVLQASPPDQGAIRFTPPLPSKIDATSRLAMGDVVRVVIRFRRRFWADQRLMRHLGARDLDQLGFLHTAGAFPT